MVQGTQASSGMLGGNGPGGKATDGEVAVGNFGISKSAFQPRHGLERYVITLIGVDPHRTDIQAAIVAKPGRSGLQQPDAAEIVGRGVVGAAFCRIWRGGKCRLV